MTICEKENKTPEIKVRHGKIGNEDKNKHKTKHK